MKQLPTKQEIQPVELQEISEVETNLSESDIDHFETISGETDEIVFIK